MVLDIRVIKKKFYTQQCIMNGGSPFMQITELQLVNKKLILPNFIPSISSIKTNYHPVDYLRILNKIGYPNYLISAYDIYYSFNSYINEFEKLINESNEKGQIIFLDSGNYEYFWNKFNPWHKTLYYRKLKKFRVDFSFSFDGKVIDNQNIVDSVCERVLEQENFAGSSIVIPIVQVSNTSIIDNVFEVAEKLDPFIIAIPERILGDGILKRSKMIKSIRHKLNSTGKYYPLHLLGTGNPRSILAYIYAGADCFDGLEWCQTFVEPNTGILYHFQQGDIFLTNVDRDINYTTNILLNNLKYYNSFIDEIQNTIKNQTFEKMLGKYFDDNFVTRLRKELL
jgi:queuine/archaeosine tRNA-ribosyltransferase